MEISAVNALSYEDFVDILGNVVEKCPLITAAVWPQRPFRDVADLETAISHFIDSLPEPGKCGLLRCLPDLAGRELHQGTLSQESHQEQSGAGMYSLSSEEALNLSRLNQEYKERFGFPFVICARISDKLQIMQQMSERCKNEPEKEVARGLEEVKKICHLRLQGLVHSSV